MDEGYDYFYTSEDPDELFEKTNGFFEEVKDMMSNLALHQEKDFEDFIIDNIIHLIFGSNFIERAGSDINVTIDLCRKIFTGEPVPETINEGDPQYEAIRRELVQRELPGDHNAVTRSRREIVQHALALKHIVLRMVEEDETLSEQLIKDTHRILCHQIDSPDGMSFTEYAGMYRTDEVGAGVTSFLPAVLVPMSMKKLVSDFNTDIATAEKIGELDPYALAAKYCHKFVNIHPFIDGNGRTCRLILNAILLKYAGIVVPLGEKEDARTEYLEIASRASLFEQSAEDERPQPAWAELSTLVIRKASVKMHDLLQKLKNG